MAASRPPERLAARPIGNRYASLYGPARPIVTRRSENVRHPGPRPAEQQLGERQVALRRIQRATHLELPRGPVAGIEARQRANVKAHPALPSAPNLHLPVVGPD